MAIEDKFQGVVSHVGLERDEAEFLNFNLTLGILVKTEKKLTYNEGERLIKRLQKELLGKNIELEAVAVPCPVCGKTFNTETGMRQHLRKQHEGEEEKPKKRTRKAPEKKAQPKKTGSKKGSSKKKTTR
ncbi:MAG: C2H2-type zinc finger protein [Candidatus Bathyarchaeota archaeon]